MKTNNKLEELTGKIEAWLDARKITTNGSAVVQACKLSSELGELYESFFMELDDAFNYRIDSIGDQYVVLTGIAKLSGFSSLYDLIKSGPILSPVGNDSKYLVANMISICHGDLCDMIIKYDKAEIRRNLVKYVDLLNIMAKTDNVSLEHCVQIAYNEIKDRTGILLANGNFVKDTSNVS